MGGGVRVGRRGAREPYVIRAPSLDPLRERPFRLLIAGRSLSGIGDAIVPVALTFAVLKHGNATDLGIVLSCEWGARVVFLLAGGVWADRLPRQLVMVGTDVMRAAVQALIAVAFFLGAVRIWQLAVAAALIGLGTAFFNPASTGLVREIVNASRLQEANALLGLSRGTIEVAGPALSGIVVTTLGFGVVFALDSASFVASFLCIAAMRLPRREPRPNRQSPLKEALEGLRAVRQRRWLVAALCCDSVFNFAFAAFFVLGPAVITRHFDGARDWGLVMTAAAIGGLSGSVVALRLMPRRPLRFAYFAAFVVPLELLALTPPVGLGVLMVGAAAVFGVSTIMNTFWATMEQQHIPADLISRVDSLSWLASLVAMPLGLAVVGPVAAAVGIRATLIAATGLAAACLVSVLSVREVRDLERVEAVPREVAPESFAKTL